MRFWDGVRVDLVLQDLLEDDAGIDSAFIPIVDWDAEADDWLGSYILSANIMKPVEVNKLVSEIVEQCGIALYSDDRDGAKIKLNPQVSLLGDELLAAPVFNDSNIIKDTLKITDDTKSRISSVWFNHTLIDPAESVKKSTNFAITDVQADSISSSENAYNKEQIKEIFSRWITSTTAADLTGSRLLARFKQAPKVVKFQVDASAPALCVGGHFYLESSDLQDEFGAAQKIEFQCISIDYDHRKSLYSVQGLQFVFSLGRKAGVAPSAQVDYLSASDSDQASYCFICDSTTLKMSNGDDPYIII